MLGTAEFYTCLCCYTLPCRTEVVVVERLLSGESYQICTQCNGIPFAHCVLRFPNCTGRLQNVL